MERNNQLCASAGTDFLPPNVPCTISHDCLGRLPCYYEPSRQLFVFNVFAGASRNLVGASLDGFVDYAQTEAGKAYQQAVLHQLREKASLRDNAEARSTFDRGEGG